MKLKTYWKVWYLATDGIWHHMTYELGHVESCYFQNVEDAEKAARRLTEGRDVVQVEVREERSVLSFSGAARKKVSGRCERCNEPVPPGFYECSGDGSHPAV